MRIHRFLVCCILFCGSARADLFVSPGGSDTNRGTTAGSAFATLQRARDELRSMRKSGALGHGPLVVHVLKGNYVLTESLEFTAEDSGTADQPVIFDGDQDGGTKLIGAKTLQLSQFKPVNDAQMLGRLDPAARGRVLVLSVETAGLASVGPFPDQFNDNGGIVELFAEGHRLPMSRWPKTGWTTMKRVLTVGDNKTPGEFEYRDEEPARWANNSNVWLRGQWRVAWEEPAMRVAKIDTQAHTITFAAGLAAGIGSKYKRPEGSGKEPWAAINLPEEITEPGEWAIDFASKQLLLYPPKDAKEIVVSQLKTPMITGKGVHHLKLTRLGIEYALGEGIHFDDADSVLIAGCRLRNVAGDAIILHGMRSGVQSCDMSDLGAACILISGGDAKTLTRSENFVINNHLHDYGVCKPMYSAAIDLCFGGENAHHRLDAVGIHVANNLIHDAPRDSVLLNGQDNLFELNDIYRCGFKSADLGSFYAWLDWTLRGIVIKNNYIHDTVGGVNPDDGASGLQVIGNIFAGPRVGVWIASGPDNITKGNIFVKDEGPVFGVDDRGVARGYATNKHLLDGVHAIDPTSPPWSDRFPEMMSLLDTHPELPQRCVFSDNLVVIQKGEPTILKMKKENQPGVSIKDNFVTSEDPGFVDVEHGNLALKKSSILYQKLPGFEPIPFEKIGLFKDEYRLQLPPDSDTRPSRVNPMTQHQEEHNFGT